MGGELGAGARDPFAELPRLLPELLAHVLTRVEEAAAAGARRGVREELDRQEQYGTARELLAGAALLPETEEITAVEAARLLGLSSSGTLLKQLSRGDADLAACDLGGKGKARRFSRARIEALKVKRSVAIIHAAARSREALPRGAEGGAR